MKQSLKMAFLVLAASVLLSPPAAATLDEFGANEDPRATPGIASVATRESLPM
jgi:hypothetical protein